MPVARAVPPPLPVLLPRPVLPFSVLLLASWGLSGLLRSVGEGYGHAFRLFICLFGALGVGFGFLMQLPVGDPLPVWNDGFIELGGTAAGLAPALPVITTNDLAPCGANPREVCSLAILYPCTSFFCYTPPSQTGSVHWSQWGLSRQYVLRTEFMVAMTYSFPRLEAFPGGVLLALAFGAFGGHVFLQGTFSWICFFHQFSGAVGLLFHHMRVLQLCLLS